VPGILNSRIGTLNGSEIVHVEFDSTQTSLPILVKTLEHQSSFYSLITKNEAERDRAIKILNGSNVSVNSSEPSFLESKYTLKTSHPELYYLDLTEQQAVVLNSWSYFGGAMPDVLTPFQKELIPRLKEKLRKQSGRSLIPARSGEALVAYRLHLVQWLEQ